MGDQPIDGSGISARCRYRAFISYSHADAASARWLHRRLEGYRIPRRLVGTAGGLSPVPARLAPIFRDQDELAASGDLTETVRSALDASACLIVLCTSNAAASLWVGREIDYFRARAGGRPVLAALFDGEPDDSFPAPLRTKSGGSAPCEPLAADFRRGRDGQRLGLLKLVAALAGVDLDDLVQRDAARRMRRVTAITLIAVLVALAMAMLAALAVSARGEAERQHLAAEGLIEFMLTDLRDRLEEVGRLDVLASANQRVLDHYAAQDVRRLPAETLARRARLLHAMGEDELAREDLASATAKFDEARRTTHALHAASPDDPDIIFSHAQSEFWVASLALQREEHERAARGFDTYARLAERLLQVAPGEVRSLQEVGYAQGNLCTLRYERDQLDGLIALCSRSLAAMRAAARRLPGDQKAQRDVANRLAWLADAYRKTGNLQAARAQREEERALIEQLLARDPNNVRLIRARIWSMRALARLDRDKKDIAASNAKLRAAIASLARLVAEDPENADLATELGELKAELSE